MAGFRLPIRTVPLQACVSQPLKPFLDPIIGYMKSAEVAKEALKRNMSVKELVIEKGILSKAEVDRIFDIEFLIGKKKADKK